MANSRLDKIGTIFSRITSLLECGAMKQQDKPLWHSVYAAFPPKYEPRYDREVVEKPIRDIFYEEDRIRAKFLKSHPHLSRVNLLRPNDRSRIAQLLTIREELKKEGVSDSTLDDTAIEKLLETMEEERKSRQIEKSKVEAKKEEPKLADDFQAENIDDEKYRPIRLTLSKVNIKKLLDEESNKTD